MCRPRVCRVDGNFLPPRFQRSVGARSLAHGGKGFPEGLQRTLADNARGPVIETVGVGPPPLVGYAHRMSDAVVGWVRGAGAWITGPYQVGEQTFVDGHLNTDTPARVPISARPQPFPGPSLGSRRGL